MESCVSTGRFVGGGRLGMRGIAGCAAWFRITGFPATSLNSHEGSGSYSGFGSGGISESGGRV